MITLTDALRAIDMISDADPHEYDAGIDIYGGNTAWAHAIVSLNDSPASNSEFRRYCATIAVDTMSRAYGARVARSLWAEFDAPNSENPDPYPHGQ
jgi:hypothetical protein